MLEAPKTLAPDYYSRGLPHKVCRKIEIEDCAAIMQIVQDMAAYCRERDGVGLAAPQVGLYVQLAIVMVVVGRIDVLINPEIVNLAGRDLLEEEGCLSLPPAGQATARVWRSEIVHIASGTLEDPHARKVTIHKGLEARVIQHEIDHLQGIFFIDRCGPVARELVLGKYQKHMQRIKQKQREARHG